VSGTNLSRGLVPEGKPTFACDRIPAQLQRPIIYPASSWVVFPEGGTSLQHNRFPSEPEGSRSRRINSSEVNSAERPVFGRGVVGTKCGLPDWSPPGGRGDCRDALHPRPIAGPQSRPRTASLPRNRTLPALRKAHQGDADQIGELVYAELQFQLRADIGNCFVADIQLIGDLVIGFAVGQ
jgi:hypothetical protein